MSDSTNQLEQRYRRLIKLYPQTFRDAHETEMVSVLMATAAPDQTQPRLGERADLVLGATRARVRYPTDWEENHHPRVWLWVRIAIGAWLLVVVAILCQYGYWWSLALLPFAVLHFALATRIGRFIDREPGRPKPQLPAPR
jgi:hypothetical protein